MAVDSKTLRSSTEPGEHQRKSFAVGLMSTDIAAEHCTVEAEAERQEVPVRRLFAVDVVRA